MLQKNHNNKFTVISSVIVSLLFIVVALLLIYNRQFIIDQITVWQFQASSDVIGLSDRAGMNDNGKFIYLASKPKLYTPAMQKAFNNACDRIENTTAILGCYSGSRIYIYDVTNQTLDGIREVTAAHETLHAIYARMGYDEKKKVDALIESEYITLKSNKDFADMMAFYARTEPGQRDNELYSIIGTEVAPIGHDLEVYYDKYFSNRQKVVDLNTKYKGVFKSLKSRADRLAAQINALISSVSARSTQYNIDNNQLSIDIAAFNLRVTNGDFSSQWQYNNERSILVRRVADLNATRDSINADVASYESMIIEYNQIASESKKLYNTIDSTLAPVPSV